MQSTNKPPKGSNPSNPDWPPDVLAGEFPVLLELNNSKPSSSFDPFVVAELAPIAKPESNPVVTSTDGVASHGEFWRGGWDWTEAAEAGVVQGSIIKIEIMIATFY